MSDPGGQRRARQPPRRRLLYALLSAIILAVLGGCAGLGLAEPLSQALLDWRTPEEEIRSGDILDFLPFALAISITLAAIGSCIGFVAGMLAGARLYDELETGRARGREG